MQQRILASVPKLCIFGLSESRFPISALWVETSDFSNRISNRFALHSNRRWRMTRPVKHDGVVYRRHGTNFWWRRYRERNGSLRKESTLTKDWHEAQKKLRDRLQARDGNFLNIVRPGENLNFGQWVDFFLENYSNPPVRELKTHEANLRAAKHLKL